MSDGEGTGRERSCDVAVVGGGPAGLAAATRLRESGIARVVVLEREREAGGIPRHCGHPPFGMREFRRCLTGPRYAAALVRRALSAGVEIETERTVVSAGKGGRLELTTPEGPQILTAKRVLLATGVRETPRSARLIAGSRPLGIVTTGALQSMVYLKKRVPFRRPLIVGTELVSFSALLTCRHVGARPVAMVEEEHRITARGFCRGLPLFLGIPVMAGARLVEIQGQTRVTGARVETEAGEVLLIDCDGILFSGRFTPESTLIRMGEFELDQDSGGPRVDSYGRCSDPAYFATGNLLRPVETAGWCWQEGRDTAAGILADLSGTLPVLAPSLPLRCTSPEIAFALPHRVYPTAGGHLQLRFRKAAPGLLEIHQDGRRLWARGRNWLPERRVTVPVPKLGLDPQGGPIDIVFRNAT